MSVQVADQVVIIGGNDSMEVINEETVGMRQKGVVHRDGFCSDKVNVKLLIYIRAIINIKGNHISLMSSSGKIMR